MISRRNFLKHSIAGAAAVGLGASALNAFAAKSTKRLPFKISLAQWSLHRGHFSGKIDPWDFAKTARERFGIGAIEYVNSFYNDAVKSPTFAKDLKQRADDHGVKSLLIMVDGEGDLGAPTVEEREKVVENHKKWIHAAAELSCHSIRVNAAGPGNRQELADAVIDGLSRLSKYAETYDINVLVENHGGFSSDGHWLASVMKSVDRSNCGTLPDFGNFCIERNEDGCIDAFDNYEGLELLMPWAKAVSAKSYDFGKDGLETSLDYPRMMGIVATQGYHGYVGVEYEGGRLSEDEGIKATRDLLKRIIEKSI
jgi:L-ribulose-5-phosphate 3-epimerase